MTVLTLLFPWAQIVDVGVIFHKGAYFRDWWNVIDALVVAFNMASLILV